MGVSCGIGLVVSAAASAAAAAAAAGGRVPRKVASMSVNGVVVGRNGRGMEEV